MAFNVECPKCKHQFELDELFAQEKVNEIKKQYDEERILSEKKIREEFLQKYNKSVNEKEQEIKLKLEDEHKSKLDFYKIQEEENKLKLKQLQENELKVMQLEKKLNEQKEDEAMNLKKQKIQIETELKEKLSKEILDKERVQFDLEKRELEKKLQDQTKLTEEMSRKLQQGSMQTQGETLEIKIEEELQAHFIYDELKEVGKGKRGADCILVVKNEIGSECGKIIFESKRTKDFTKGWLPKLKEDMLEASCDMAILVTQTLPEGIKNFDIREGVWICTFNDMIPVVKSLRQGIINVYKANKSQENKGEKKEMLYNYFTGNEFAQQVKAINEAFLFMKDSLNREKFQMEKMWKEREKQIDKLLLNNNYLIGSIEGIVGTNNDTLLIE
jgi:hypothetical protein